MPDGGLMNQRVTVNVDISRPETSIRVWERVPYHPTRQNPDRNVRVLHEVTKQILTTKSDSQSTAAATLTRSHLTLEFKKLFLRYPDPRSQQERDITFTTDDLQHVAERVWSAQGW